jgi:hypothetical protein
LRDIQQLSNGWFAHDHFLVGTGAARPPAREGQLPHIFRLHQEAF